VKHTFFKASLYFEAFSSTIFQLI